MPVWHERTRAAREAGSLALVGIAEEQHPDRCVLFAQWQRLDWPILWDPFNLTESPVVPVPIAVDEHGVVRSVRLSLERLDEFLATDYGEGAPAASAAARISEIACGPRELASDEALDADRAISRLLWCEKVHAAPLSARDFETCIGALERAATAAEGALSGQFRLGVALRLRYDSAHARPEDFQGSLDRWAAALAADPGQYVWRRRIQQWGPRLDKPYPFYGWIDEATCEVRERGATPVALRVPLTSSERVGREAVQAPSGSQPHPDPERKVPRDRSGLVTVHAAVAPHTGDRGDASERRSAQLHLALRPSAVREVYWSNDAGATEVWIDAAESWGLERAALGLPVPDDEEVSSETRHIDFTVIAPPGGGRLSGTAFYYVCEGTGGECRFLAHDFEVSLPASR